MRTANRRRQTKTAHNDAETNPRLRLGAHRIGVMRVILSSSADVGSVMLITRLVSKELLAVVDAEQEHELM
jgi:hypothetical protein